MNLKTWLNEERGRHKALADHLGVTPARISQMLDEGVPARHMLAVRNFTNAAVTLEEMVQAKTPAAATDLQTPIRTPAYTGPDRRKAGA